MNVSWSQLGSIGEFVVFAVNGTSGRGGAVERRNGIVAGVLSNWVWQCRAIIGLTCFSFWTAPSVTDVMFKILGWDVQSCEQRLFVSWPREFAEVERSQCKIRGIFLVRLGISEM
ncbi:hypothetical protein CSKR_112922 [Clonorchis sinensis]|uniref:Uncharacterized protein n=1 Tax=Clonorchis sinensis TaxID=79923 RepID=A0A419PML7_CLOSI|nr:hypothetical protein CSKR_112922 [Clonorchis sinensis]